MKRPFITGEEWIYYKIYCGNRTSDVLLTEIIKPLTESLIEKEIIDKWFFIRYADPENHIRVRFHCSDVSRLGEVIQVFKENVRFYIESNLVWKIQTDTYHREFERYGINNIINSEELFFYDSASCVRALILIDDDEVLFFYVIRNIDSLFSLFQVSIEEKIIISKKNRDRFKKEFNADKNLSKQLNKKYQGLRMKFEQFMLPNLNSVYKPLVDILNFKERKMKPTVKRIMNKENVDDKLLSSYIHMMVNRFFRDKQRLHELVCYDFLYRYYNSVNAKKRSFL